MVCILVATPVKALLNSCVIVSPIPSQALGIACATSSDSFWNSTRLSFVVFKAVSTDFNASCSAVATSS